MSAYSEMHGRLAVSPFFGAAEGADASWEPARLLVKLAEEGRTFNQA